MQNIQEIEREVLTAYDNGKYMPLGADGGALSYVLLGDYETGTRASITTDTELSAIRRIWALSVGGKVGYDFTREYYSARV